MTVTLCVVFNHPYPKNIDTIREMYAEKFDNVIFVQPFLASDRPDVVVSHRGSYNFQGLIFDAIPAIERLGSDYVVFAQDDCIINPRLTKQNIITELNVGPDRPYFGLFSPIAGPIDTWPWMLPTIWRSFYSWSPLVGTGVENFIRYLPDSEAARLHLEKCHGMRFTPITPPTNERIRHGTVSDEGADVAITQALVDGLFKTAPQDGITLNYPWVFGMSDFFVVSLDSLKKIGDFLGVTAAVSLFVEVAIPTALAIYHDEISTPRNNNWKLDYIWGSDRDRNTPEDIERSFASNTAVIHPVKLSKSRYIVEEIYGVARR